MAFWIRVPDVDEAYRLAPIGCARDRGLAEQLAPRGTLTRYGCVRVLTKTGAPRGERQQNPTPGRASSRWRGPRPVGKLTRQQHDCWSSQHQTPPGHPQRATKPRTCQTCLQHGAGRHGRHHVSAGLLQVRQLRNLLPRSRWCPPQRDKRKTLPRNPTSQASLSTHEQQ